ncbi:MAG: hypothetical protein AB7K08_07775 [Microbacteriaceae bacterium]
MTDQFQALKRRFGSLRPGLQLIAIEDAALPVTVVMAEVLAQEKKKLPVSEEFVLRFVDAGVRTPAEIASYLGLDLAHVIDAVALQLAGSHIRRTPDDQLVLTETGKEVVRLLVATQPVIRELPVVFDRVTWTPADIPERFLLEKRQAEEAGFTIIPASRNAAIGLSDVSPSGMNSLFEDDRLQVLRVNRVSTRKHRYLPAQLLVYGDASRNEIELALYFSDEISAEHGLALDAMGASSKLKISLGQAEPRPVLDDDLEMLRQHDSDGIAEETPAPTVGAVATAQVRSVSVFEHADLLSTALETSKKRLLLMSPWVRGKVVNASFRSRLEERLRAGVSATIAYGIGDDDSGSDSWALDHLRKLANKYSNFDFVRLRNTHAKILIYDDNWINTSFNWLSFKGDPDRTYRMEEGTLVTVPDRVEKEYRGYLALIDDQRA